MPIKVSFGGVLEWPPFPDTFNSTSAQPFSTTPEKVIMIGFYLYFILVETPNSRYSQFENRTLSSYGSMAVMLTL